MSAITRGYLVLPNSESDSQAASGCLTVVPAKSAEAQAAESPIRGIHRGIVGGFICCRYLPIYPILVGKSVTIFWITSKLQDAPRCSKYGKANGNNHPQNHLYGLYKPSPNGTSMALGLPGNTTLPQQWQLDLLVDRCALAHREHIMISHQRGPGRCQISTRHLGISQ